MPKSRSVPPRWLTREQTLVIALGLATLGIVWLCLRLLAPFVSGLTWALTLAVVGWPIHRWLCRKVGRPSIAAALATICVTLVVAVPAALTGIAVAREALDSAETIRALISEKGLNSLAERAPSLAPVIKWGVSQVKDASGLQQLADGSMEMVRKATSTSIQTAMSALLTVFFLFYFFRDRTLLLDALPHFLPLSQDESSEVLTQIRDMIEAMVYGTLAVSVIQGVLGGLAFWFLDLPSPILWGAIMAVLSVLPLFGAALVWIPAALYLALTGETKSAIILTVWGAVVIGLVDNVLKPLLVRGKLDLHTVPVFIAVLGGLFVFGGTGLVLGPVVLAIALGVFDVWRRRFALPPVEEVVENNGTAPAKR